jgi:C-terminal processing protease CtpA/Prc
MVAAFDMNKQSLEGVGIEPDIPVDLDEDQHNLGHDTQLERALQYIRTGN